MKISVIIPTKNEPYITKLIPSIHKQLKNYHHEIIVVDLSDTPPKIKDAKLVLQRSEGLGNAVLEGLKHTSGDIIVLMDGDGSHRPENIPKLLERINDNDIVIGSRFIEGGETHDKTHRKFLSWIFRNFTSGILNLNIKDSMSGFSAVKRGVYDSIELNPLGFKINMELVYKAKKKCYKICEVPILFRPRQAGKSNIGIKEPLRIIRYIIELKLDLR